MIPKQLFNDLAAVSIYHFADVLYKTRAQRAARRLARQGFISNINDAETAYRQYEEAVIEYALANLPGDYKARHDYWGARCISNAKTMNAPRQSLFAGDNIGRIMLFDSFKALEQYTQDKVNLH
jgi:hypothetical protein